METQTDTSFWMLKGLSPGEEPLVLCEKHALEASNAAYDIFGMYPCQNMSEVANLMALICALSECHDHDGDFIVPAPADSVCPECK